MNMRSLSIRRWGVAAITAVTLLGGLSILGDTAASAATTPTVSAASASALNIAGTGTTEAGSNITLTVNGTVSAGDVIVLTLAHPATGTASFTAATSGDSNWLPTFAAETTTKGSTLSLTAQGPETNATIALSGITYTLSGVSSQALSISGVYETLGAASTSFTVPTDANVVWFTVSANAPAVTIPKTGTTVVSPIVVTDPSNIGASQITGAAGEAAATDLTSTNGTVISEPNSTPGNLADPQLGLADIANNVIRVTAGSSSVTAITAVGLPTGMALTDPSPLPTAGTAGNATLTGTPTAAGSYTVVVTATDGGATPATATFTLVVGAATINLNLPTGIFWSGTPTVFTDGFTVTAPGAQAGNSNVLALTVTGELASGGQSLTVSNASITTNNVLPGMVPLGITYNGGTVMFSSVSVGTILGSVTTIAGADGTADGTVAVEFENAYPAATGGNNNVVLATDTAATNGSDSLAASYLEGTLHTGLLITPSTSLGTDAQQAMQLEGVQNVYIVGGPLAVDAAVIAQIKALPAYTAGGLTQTGKNINVVSQTYGADGTAEGTAAAIATLYGSAYASLAVPGAYGTTYNDTTGTASASGPTTAVPTAIVLATNDWQDAMSIAPEAFNQRIPVILAGQSTETALNADASAALTTLGVKQVILMGGQLAVTSAIETQIAALNGGISVLRIAGIDGTDTAAQIANFALAASPSGLGWTATDKNTVLASHADYWSDALGSAALGGGANASFGTEPLILVENPTTVGTYTTSELAKLAKDGVTGLTVLGGPLAMPSSTVSALQAGL